MNPNFALDFRNDQIVLLHAQEGLWVQIGTVAVDDPDLDAALGYLRSTALGLSPRGIASKLILPDAAVLFTSIGNLSPDAQTRATQIALGLVGRTPYAVADLVYVWTDEGATAHLAVIARETLDEAEAFASQHRFNPVAFAAWPEQGQYPGEADFGRSAGAMQINAPVTKPQGPAAAHSASDFEMGDVPKDVPAPQPIVEESIVKRPEIVEVSPPPRFDLVLEPEAPVYLTAPQNLGEDHSPDDLDPTQDPAETSDIETVSAPLRILPDAPRNDLAGQDSQDPNAGVQHDLAPQPSFAAVMADDTVDEAPMALDVPSEEVSTEEPTRISLRSAGKAQTLLAEFAGRRETALVKSDTSGRVEPILSSVKAATPLIAPPVIALQSVKPIRTDATPEIGAATLEKSLIAPHTSLGNKPAIKRPIPKTRGTNSVLMGFVLTVLLLLALMAAAAMASYVTAAWNGYSASTAVALNQPSIADEMAADLPDTLPEESPAPQIGDLSSTSAPIAFPAPTVAMVSQSQSSLVPLVVSDALPRPIVVAPPDLSTVSAPIARFGPMTTAPSAQGEMTPEGVFLIAGQPIGRDTPVANTQAVPQGTVAEILDTAAVANPELAGKKPVMRPEGLAPKVNSDPALAGKRPAQRPESVIAAVLAAQQDANAPRSALAVTISRLPVPRPSNLKIMVTAPQEIALATPDLAPPETAAVANDAAPIEADNEPEVVATKSSGPRTVVSKNATFKNAINLSQMNLIGVYGSQANRYALIRQSNGRFKKVYVGDRFDGGLVAAITESELRYSKGGQMLALQMPKG